METAFDISIEAKMGIKLVWNQDNSMEVGSTSSHMYTRVSCLWSSVWSWSFKHGGNRTHCEPAGSKFFYCEKDMAEVILSFHSSHPFLPQNLP